MAGHLKFSPLFLQLASLVLYECVRTQTSCVKYLVIRNIKTSKYAFSIANLFHRLPRATHFSMVAFQTSSSACVYYKLSENKKQEYRVFGGVVSSYFLCTV